MEILERGARIYVHNLHEDNFGKTGTVAHLHGDPGFAWDEEHVKIAFDGETDSSWVAIADIARL